MGRASASTGRWLRAAAGALVGVGVSLTTPSTGAQPAAPAPAHVWLDSAGQPLPFQTSREILDYLRTADVVSRSPIGQGVTGSERILLDRGGVRVRAAFRTEDQTYHGPFENLPLSVRRVRDAAIFECAAYELSEALGLGRVPPTVWRRIGKTSGSVQIWLEGALTQDRFLGKSPDRSDVEQWNLQKHLMYVFDALVANLDRNQGNILVDGGGRLWFIDHSRAFAQTGDLLQPEKVTRCSRDLWRALRAFDEASVRERLAPFLRKAEIDALFKRRRAIVARIEKLIADEGESAVLFDLGSPVGPAGEARSDPTSRQP
jgi:hypothetical protein